MVVKPLAIDREMCVCLGPMKVEATKVGGLASDSDETRAGRIPESVRLAMPKVSGGVKWPLDTGSASSAKERAGRGPSGKNGDSSQTGFDALPEAI